MSVEGNPKITRCAGVVVVRRGENGIFYVVLEKQNKNKRWSLPKGKVGSGEEDDVAALYETFEETGLLPSDLSSFQSFRTYVRARATDDGTPSPDLKKHISVFLAKTNEENLTPAGNIYAELHTPDIEKAAWVPINKVAPYFHNPEDRNFFQKHKEEILIALFESPRRSSPVLEHETEQPAFP